MKKSVTAWLLYFPVLLIWYEFLFRFVTMRELSFLQIICILLLTIALGFLMAVIPSLIKNAKARRITCLVISLVIAVIFLIEYFIYREFKVFYDPKMIIGTAGNMAGQAAFVKTTLKMIFSLTGLLTIVCYLAPPIVFFIVMRRWDIEAEQRRRESARRRGTSLSSRRRGTRWQTLAKRAVLMAAVSLLIWLLAQGLILIASPLRAAATNEYTFSAAVRNFGLMTGVRMDLTRGSGDSSSFDPVGPAPSIPTTQPSTDPAGSEPAQTDENGETVPETEPEEKPLSERDTDFSKYGYSMLDLDFTAMAAAADDGTIKALDEYCASLTPSHQNRYTGLFKGKNLILISAEAFSGDIIDPKLTPTLYRMATKGIQFTDYTQPDSAGTTGGEYQNIFGMLPMLGGPSFRTMSGGSTWFNIAGRLNLENYYGKAFHNNTYTYYKRDVTHNQIGYSDGYMGYGNGMEQFVQKTWPESDLEMMQGTIPMYIDKQPFNIYYMTVSGHSDYGRSDNRMASKHWDEVKDLPYSDLVKGYIACNLELEAAMTYLIDQLEQAGIADDTLIVMSADHFPYGLDGDAALGHSMPYLSELYGYDVKTYLQRDHNRLLMWSGIFEKEDPIVVSEPTSSLDILPTLCNLYGVPWDSRVLPGRDVFSDAPALMFNTEYDWKTELGSYINASKTFTPAEGVNEADIPEGYVDQIRAIVRNKIRFCKNVLEVDFFKHVKEYLPANAK